MKEKKYRTGYTTGVFDLFHVGHVNILRRAKEMCDTLIVGVSTDELVEAYKHRRPVVPFEERCAVVLACRYVDEVVPQTDRDKFAAFEKYRFDTMFVGDDWRGNPLFVETERKLGEHGAEVVYFPYTGGTSSTKIREALDKFNGRE